jgi:hypothetical protein
MLYWVLVNIIKNQWLSHGLKRWILYYYYNNMLTRDDDVIDSLVVRKLCICVAYLI